MEKPPFIIDLEELEKEKAAKKKIFVGRREEIALYKEKLKKAQKTPIWNIYGIGGVGKTCLRGNFSL